MQALLALAALVAGVFVALSVRVQEPPSTAGALRPAIESLAVLDYLRVDEVSEPKLAGTRAVHVLASHSVELIVRTEHVERVDVLVALSGTESFGVYSGEVSRNGLALVEVELPEAGSMHDWRIPGPEGLRRPGPVREGTVFMLVPYGIAGVGATGGAVLEAVVAQGDVLWVRVEE